MSEQTKQQVIEVDMRGQICPACLLVAMDQLNRNRSVLQSGMARICIKTDNREATNTIPVTAKNMGYQVKVSKEAACYEICVGRPFPGEPKP